MRTNLKIREISWREDIQMGILNLPDECIPSKMRQLNWPTKKVKNGTLTRIDGYTTSSVGYDTLFLRSALGTHSWNKIKNVELRGYVNDDIYWSKVLKVLGLGKSDTYECCWFPYYFVVRKQYKADLEYHDYKFRIMIEEYDRYGLWHLSKKRQSVRSSLDYDFPSKDRDGNGVVIDNTTTVCCHGVYAPIHIPHIPMRRYMPFRHQYYDGVFERGISMGISWHLKDITVPLARYIKATEKLWG